MSKNLLTNFYSDCFKKLQAFKIQHSRYREANWDMFLNVTRSLPLTLSCETFTQGPWLLITAQHTAALLQFILQDFDLPADYLWASGSESEFFHPVYYHQQIPNGERSQWMIPPSNSIPRVSSRTETAAAKQQKSLHVRIHCLQGWKNDSFYMQTRNKNLLIPSIAFRQWIKHSAHVLIKGQCYIKY